MDPTSLETWKQQWAAFWSAPYIILPFVVASFGAAWWLRGNTKEGEIAGLEREISAKDERLKLADDKTAAVERYLEKLKKEFQDYKKQVAINGNNASSAKVDAAIVRVTSGNAEIRKKLFDALMSRET
jgi:septal ring factor EnvC (AmiA/AmiB activator)